MKLILLFISLIILLYIIKNKKVLEFFSKSKCFSCDQESDKHHPSKCYSCEERHWGFEMLKKQDVIS